MITSKRFNILFKELSLKLKYDYVSMFAYDLALFVFGILQCATNDY